MSNLRFMFGRMGVIRFVIDVLYICVNLVIMLYCTGSIFLDDTLIINISETILFRAIVEVKNGNTRLYKIATVVFLI